MEHEKHRTGSVSQGNGQSARSLNAAFTFDQFKLHEISFIAFSLEGYSNLSVSCSVIMVNALDADVLSYQDSCSTASRSNQVTDEIHQRKFTIQSNLQLGRASTPSSEKTTLSFLSPILIFAFLSI